MLNEEGIFENIQEEIEQETVADRIKTSKAETSDSIETQEPELPKIAI